MYVELLNEKELYYRVSGDFYNNGSMSISSGGSIGVGEFASLSFQVTNSSSHYAYCFYADTSRIVIWIKNRNGNQCLNQKSA